MAAKKIENQTQRPGFLPVALRVFSAVAFMNLWLCVFPAFAADEICAACGQQGSVSGDFAHRKDDASVTIAGATSNAAAFREEINGKSFTVTIAHLPAGRYTIVIGEVETLAGGPGERLFDVTSGDVALATNFDIVATAGGARKVCYLTGMVEHEDDSIKGALAVTFAACPVESRPSFAPQPSAPLLHGAGVSRLVAVSAIG